MMLDAMRLYALLRLNPRLLVVHQLFSRTKPRITRNSYCSRLAIVTSTLNTWVVGHTHTARCDYSVDD